MHIWPLTLAQDNRWVGVACAICELQQKLTADATTSLIFGAEIVVILKNIQQSPCQISTLAKSEVIGIRKDAYFRRSRRKCHLFGSLEIEIVDPRL